MLGQAEVICPPELLRSAAAAGAVRTGVVCADNEIAMQSAMAAADAGVVRPVLIGDRDVIQALARKLNWAEKNFEIRHAVGEAEAAEAGARMAGGGELAAVMKGHIHTDTFMRALLGRAANLRTGNRLSHVFHMTAPDRAGEILITDAAVNVAPDFETKKSIIANAVGLAQVLGHAVPHVALLSATEEETETIPSSMEAARLRDWAAGNLADAEVYGPLAMDLAISAEAARVKGVTHAVAGRADVIVVPEIVCGNALFKMMVYYMNACAGGIVLGAKVPILLTSRADPPAARLASAALAALMQTAA